MVSSTVGTEVARSTDLARSAAGRFWSKARNYRLDLVALQDSNLRPPPWAGGRRWRSARRYGRSGRSARAIAWPAAPSDKRRGASDHRRTRWCRDGSRSQRVYLPHMAHPALETAAPLVPERPTLEKLRAAAAGCRACPLYKTGT